MKIKAKELAEVLDRIVTRMKPKHQGAQQKLWEAWKSAVGEEKANHTRVIGLRRGQLYVEVESSALLQELTVMNKANIKARMQEKMEGLFLTEIMLKLAKG
ncbi:MAG: DciA family protein [Planctomycetota bacterium]|jgi:predicted nucleic acid-binding Zn ribbon protein